MATIGFTVPPFFSGVLVVVLFSVKFSWLSSIYDSTHVVNDWESFVIQFIKMIVPAMVLEHVLHNSLIPVITVIALGVPAVIGDVIMTEQVSKENGIN